MSRVSLTPKDHSLTVEVGYDRPLSTYFIYVAKVPDSKLDDPDVIEFNDRWNPHTVIEKVQQYCGCERQTTTVISAILNGRDIVL